MKEEESWDLDEMIRKSKTISRETVERALKQDGNPGEISSTMNLNYGRLNDSLGQPGSEPKFLLYDHSPGFNSGETGYVKVQGKIPEEHRTKRIPGQNNAYRKDHNVRTEYVKLEVLPEEAMPNKALFIDQNIPEGILQHDEIQMQPGENVMMQIYPWDEGEITGTNWENNIQNYEQGNIQH